MGRISLLLIGAIAAAANPGLRERLAPYAESMLTPVHEWSARYRVSEISRALRAETALGRPLPPSSELQTFLEERYPGSLSRRDPWGSPYYLRRDWWEARVGSPGRDGLVGTRDDILSPAVPSTGL